MNKFSNRLTDCRSRLLDAEATLNFLRNRENLNNLLEHDSPDVVVGAMIDQAWNLVASASGDCEAMTEATNEDLGAELQRTANQIIEAGGIARQKAVEGETNQALDYFDELNEIHIQTDSLLAMFHLYLNQAQDGGETFNEHLLANYVWQLQRNMSQAQKLAEAA